eukprot:CAMPEP_0181185732 /NCGR_PEP_ID=MMETSP1096-20121128/9664_1 /TAXON_ID=156174 ORGANISM="Chrysochromulina ericina, Strain CCMP281" /NCGR_SAMPLE_ID=MMETSP1096 /ASSEMBLY_ACC=CAM_ASM_000453 /LENGTH=167 /DNA_ID=CAMNT_0023274595 /DNA_START=664 /DNA_END=1167 /DNA_ORIENTATION=-
MAFPSSFRGTSCIPHPASCILAAHPASHGYSTTCIPRASHPTLDPPTLKTLRRLRLAFPVEHVGNLGTEASRKMQSILAVVCSSGTESERSQQWIGLAVIDYRGDTARAEGGDSEHVLKADAHRMAGHPLGVRDQYLPQTLAKSCRERRHLRSRPPFRAHVNVSWLT